MARPLRYWYPEGMYHVIINTHNKDYLLQAFREKLILLKIIKQHLIKLINKGRPKVYIIAYAILSNHIHLLIQLPTELKEKQEYIFSELLRNALSQYAKKYNTSHSRMGQVFMDRAKTIAIQNMKYLGEVIKYIILNPVRTGIISRAREAKEGLSSYITTILGIKGELELIEIPEEIKELIKVIKEEIEEEVNIEEETEEIKKNNVAYGDEKWIEMIESKTKPWKVKLKKSS